MTDFAVTGKKRTGKGLLCAGIIRDAVRAGRRVATNMDIYLDEMMPPSSKVRIIRLPDTPSVEDLEAIGLGNDIVDDDKNGIIILDEASKFFNSRSWGDKGRQPMLDWLIHSGKLGWDVYYQMQGLEQVDKQLRNTQVEYEIVVKRTDRWPIPFVTSFFSLFGLTVRFPKMHVGIVRHGTAQHSMVVERKWYRAKDLHSSYDTRQIFLDRDHPDAVGLHSVLSAWDLRGRYLPQASSFWVTLFRSCLPGRSSASSSVSPAHSKHHLVVLLSRLNPDDAVRHWKRLEALGAFK